MTKDSRELLARIGTALYEPDALTRQEADTLYDTLDALVAEVERLRAEVSYLRACVPPTRPTDYGHEAWTETVRAAVDAERAAVVAWLRADELDCEHCGRLWNVEPLADAIERGDHRRKEER